MKRYLVVEDEELSRSILNDYLSEFASCDTAENGSQGFERFKKAIVDGNPYDLVCTDHIMPLMDGYDLIKKIREFEDTEHRNVRTNIFVISMSNSSVDMSHAILECDCDDYIVKPFHRDQLKSQLDKYNLI